MRGGVAVFALAAALLAGGCGTGGISKAGDTDRGKKLFLDKCGGCHTLSAAGTHGNQGPNLDDAFVSARRQGFKAVTIEQVVRDQIELAVPPMPQNLVTGSDADPLQAIEDAVRTFGPDEIIISTHPAGRSHWLERGIVAGARERFAVPITHVVVDLDAEASP